MGNNDYSQEFKRIKILLKENPKGLTVSEISSSLGINRNSIAKYLDILHISGQIDRRSIGPAKLFYISKRIPTSTLMNFSSDAIILINQNFIVLQANDCFIELFDLNPKEITGEMINKIEILNQNETFHNDLKLIETNSEITNEIEILIKDKRLFIKYKILKILFDDNTYGYTIFFENITYQKEKEISLNFKLNFEKVIADIAIDMIDIADINAKMKIMTALKNLGQIAKVQASYIFLISNDNMKLNCISEWNDGTVKKMDEVELSSRNPFKHWMKKLNNFENVFAHLSRLKWDTKGESQFLNKINVSSLLLCPLQLEGNLIGFIGFNSSENVNYWDEDMISLLNFSGRIFVEVMKKKDIL